LPMIAWDVLRGFLGDRRVGVDSDDRTLAQVAVAEMGSLGVAAHFPHAQLVDL